MSKLTAGVRCSFAAFATLLFTIPCFASSQIRIVRLSAVQGEVQIDRATGQGFEKAFLNLPVTQGGKIRTGDDGFAEVEFEDASTLRIAPHSVVEFPQLALEDSGNKTSTVNVALGTVYLTYAAAKDSQLSLTFEKEHVTLAKATHMRVQVGHSKAEVAVMNGDAQVGGPSGVIEVSKKRSALFDLANQDQYTLAKNVEEASYDAWDKQQDQYHQRTLQRASVNNSPYAYGMGDLSYYGNYYSVPGYGMMWQPYLTGAGWDPFMDGAWAYYPGAGYSWVSAYPWGWTPYHSGSWMFVSNYGWMWQPGGTWMGLSNGPVVGNMPTGFSAPRPPTTPMRSLVMVNRGPVGTAAIAASANNKMVIRNGTAGLGIPRGSVQNLGKVSQQVQQRGSVTTTLHSAPPPVAYRTQAPGARMAGPGMQGQGRGQAQAQGQAQRSAPAPRSQSQSTGMSRPSGGAPAPSFHPSAAPAPSGGGARR
jgi:hypothetical protein